jgi:iron complex transport system ATP-binding protein
MTLPEQPHRASLILLTGDKHSGKTSLLRSWLSDLKKERIPVSGYLNQAVWKNKKITGYDLVDIEKESITPFLRRSGEKNWEKTGEFTLVPAGMKQACDILERKSGQVCIVDEIGPLEIAGEGIAPVLWKILRDPELTYVLVARRKILWDVIRKLGAQSPVLVDLSDGRHETLNNLSRLLISPDQGIA